VHRLIAKQIAKATDAAGAVDVDKLVELIGSAYDEFDRDRRRTDRSMSLMIEEIDAVNRNLERLVAKRSAELRARERDLQAQNVRFDIAINNMTQGLLLFDSEARLIVCNQSYIAMYGLSPDIVRPGITTSRSCQPSQADRIVRRRRRRILQRPFLAACWRERPAIIRRRRPMGGRS
jgi:PAS domain-containing protein